MVNLLRSHGGISLSPEICLIIVEHAIDMDPKAVRNLMRVSKPLQMMLETYQNSILKCIIQGDSRLKHVNIAQNRIHATRRMAAGKFTADRMTYPWLSEIRCRIDAIDFLIQHEITEMTDPEHHWPSLDISKRELEERLSLFKKDGLHLLYRLSDCAAGFKDKEVIRTRQAKFLEGELSISDLAALGVIVEVMGQGFFNITNNALQQSGLLRASVRFLQSNHLFLADSLQGIQFSNLSASTLYRPSSVPIQDLNNPNWIRECMCVFEDLVQTYGPCFASAYVDGWKRDTRRPDLWARMMLQKGLDDMNAFEMGHTMSFASLQSVVWRVFCRKANCQLQESWDLAKEVVEERMGEYKLVNRKGA